MEDLMKSIGNKPRTGLVVKCKICNKKFYVKPSHFKIRKTCSRNCHNKLQENKYYNKCKICGKEYSRPKSQEKWRGSNYCSNKCKWVGIGETHKGKNNHSWQGGISRCYKFGYHSKKYKQWRESIFKRDNWTCRFCGRRSKSKNPLLLEAHHIFRFAYHKSLRFNLFNGITLCRECHQKTKLQDKKSKLILIK